MPASDAGQGRTSDGLGPRPGGFRRSALGSILFVAALVLAVVLGRGSAADTIDLNRLAAVHVAETADPAEARAARILQTSLQTLTRKAVAVRKGAPSGHGLAVVVGRTLTIDLGLVSEAQIEAVKRDGFVVRASAGRIAVAGYGPQGTVHGAYALLRRLGFQIFPWRLGNSLERVAAQAPREIMPFTLVERPFFEYRDILDTADRGRFGGTMREYALGDLRFAAEQPAFKGGGYLGWDHTAAYLVPPYLYADEHPQYFGYRNGSPLPKSTENKRVVLCMCQPDVTRIAAERTLAWMGLQPERRYFAITDGDSVSHTCPQCAPTDPSPDYTTDRLLGWVNGIARHVGAASPQNTLVTFAYLNSVKPPLATGLEPNVLVAYAPWYWSSRATSAVGFEHPLNVVAMEELLDWSNRFPQQIGVYDYPRSWIDGLAERIKLYARLGVRWIYLNGPEGDLLQWVASRLMWDPWLDTEDLKAEFIDAFYGPAAAAMAAYYRVLADQVERGARHSLAFLDDPAFFLAAREHLLAAERASAGTDPGLETRILQGVAEGLHTLLNGVSGLPSGLSFDEEIERLSALRGRILVNAKALALPEPGQNRLRRQHDQELKRLRNKSVPTTEATLPGPAGERETSTAPDDGRAVSGHTSTAADRHSQRVRFDGADEASRWTVKGTDPGLLSGVVVDGTGAGRGVRIEAPLSRPPAVRRGSRTVRAGRFHAERAFEPPLALAGRRFIDLRVVAGSDVPATIYLNGRGGSRHDVHLHAGEQTVRIDLSNLGDDRNPLRGAPQRIDSIAIDLWPRDAFYPYPAAADTVLRVLELTLSDRMPTAEAGTGPGLHLTHFRANLPFDAVIRSLAEAMTEAHRGDPRGERLDAAYATHPLTERFRSFTAHRLVSPIQVILTGGAVAGEREAAVFLQELLARAFGVELPIDPPGQVPGPATGNAFVLGAKAATDARLIDQPSLDRAGAEGFVIRARDGRVAIAGLTPRGTRRGIVRYLEDQGVRFPRPGAVEGVSGARSRLLHELHTIDWPVFADPDLSCPSKAGAPADGAVLARLRALALEVKDAARRGDRDLPPSLKRAAAADPVSCDVISRLMWNPMADTSRLIRIATLP